MRVYSKSAWYFLGASGSRISALRAPRVFVDQAMRVIGGIAVIRLIWVLKVIILNLSGIWVVKRSGPQLLR